jgi:hypothetical protein
LHKYPSPTLTCGSIEPPSPTRGEGTITATALALLLTMSNSLHRSRGAFFAPRVCNFASLTPNRGVGGAPRNVRVLGGTPVGPARNAAGQALARRLASHDAGRSPLGAPPWRFWALGAALLSPAFAPDRLQRAPRSQVVVPGGRLPEPLEASGYGAARRETPRLAPHSGSSLEHALSEQGWKSSSNGFI